MRLLTVAGVSSLVLLAGCDLADRAPSGPAAGSAPGRPPVAVAKEISMASREELIGAWTCHELNPYPGQPSVKTDVSFAADGLMTSAALLPMADHVPEGGDLRMTLKARWSVAGDRLVTTGTEVDVEAADGDAGQLSDMAASAAALFADQAHDGSAEILRVSATELVMRGEEEEAPTISCLRKA